MCLFIDSGVFNCTRPTLACSLGVFTVNKAQGQLLASAGATISMDNAGGSLEAGSRVQVRSLARSAAFVFVLASFRSLQCCRCSRAQVFKNSFFRFYVSLFGYASVCVCCSFLGLAPLVRVDAEAVASSVFDEAGAGAPCD